MFRATCAIALAALLAMTASAPAQGVVVATYAAPVAVAPAPVVTAYYPPAVVAYPPRMATAYYAGPAVVTYRYPLLRPFTTVVRVTPTAVAVPTVSYYPPAVIYP
jgi:hypothetical protein